VIYAARREAVRRLCHARARRAVSIEQHGRYVRKFDRLPARGALQGRTLGGTIFRNAQYLRQATTTTTTTSASASATPRACVRFESRSGRRILEEKVRRRRVRTPLGRAYRRVRSRRPSSSVRSVGSDAERCARNQGGEPPPPPAVPPRLAEMDDDDDDDVSSFPQERNEEESADDSPETFWSDAGKNWDGTDPIRAGSELVHGVPINFLNTEVPFLWDDPNERLVSARVRRFGHTPRRSMIMGGRSEEEEEEEALRETMKRRARQAR